MTFPASPQSGERIYRMPQLFIHGEWRDGTAETVTRVINQRQRRFWGSFPTHPWLTSTRPLLPRRSASGHGAVCLPMSAACSLSEPWRSCWKDASQSPS